MEELLSTDEHRRFVNARFKRDSAMNKLLKPEEVAELLGVRLSTIYQWTHLGFIPHAKLRRFVRFDLEEIEKWVKARSKEGRVTKGIDISKFGV